MEYIKVLWHHDFDDEPVLLYSELDSDRFESRKVEVYRDGRQDFADATQSTGSTMPSESPIPEARQIGKDRQFTPLVIDSAEFEAVWQRAVRSRPADDSGP